ncbi:microtubule-associated tumor suppressor 1 homolog A isoform X2 [Gadus macrocephalus]|uniref:microtubule-associated tumor suppressor 1 homolog A isoform X2 n=1 Tax=Gadus macrocephalus TaxID=80720 RepID=UPI0028CB98BE|nr:microtubule-associated tumor suppressor 1 homolog A isoform X2 [Gadus macrocephalus]
MSNEIFGMSADHMGNMNGSLSCGGLPLASGYHNNSTASPETTTPCSSTSLSHLGDLDGNSSPDDYVLSCCEPDSHVDSPCPKPNRLSEVRMNLHKACFTPPVNDLVNALNQSISLMGGTEMSLLEGNYFYKNSGDGGDDPRALPLTSPESTEGPWPLGSREASRRCSPENNCCSLSSGEFVMRSNSFNLEEEELPVLTSQEELFMSPLALLQDECPGLQDKKYMEGFTVEETNSAYSDMMKWHLAEKEEFNNANLHVTLPIEMKLDFLSTFLSDSVNSEADQEAPPSAEASAEVGKPSNLNATFVASQQMNCTTLVDPTAAGHDSAPKAQTSTPLLNLGNSFSLLSFSGSSFSGSTDSPALCPPQGLHIPPTLKPQRVARLSSISGKAVKTDIRTFPKPDYSGVKSKITTRLSHQLATPAKAMLPKSSKMNGCAKPSQVNLKALNKVATAKLPHTAAAVSQTTASIGVPKEEYAVTGDMQKTFSQSDGEDVSAANPSRHVPLSISEDAEGVSKGSLRNSLGTGNEDATSALSAELSPCLVQAASGQEVTCPPKRPSFNITFCSSLPLQTPDKHGDPKPSIKVSHRNGVGSGCPLARRQSVDSLTSQHGAAREKRRTSSSSVFNLSSATQTSASPRSRSLSNKQDEEAGVEMETPEGTSREFRKISLVSHQRLRWQTHRVPHVTKARADLEAVRHPDNLECSRRLVLPP